MSLYFSSAGLSFLIGIVYFNFFPTEDVYISFKVSYIIRSMDRIDMGFSFCSLSAKRIRSGIGVTLRIFISCVLFK